VTARRARRHGKAGRIVSRRGIQPADVGAIGQVEFLLLCGGKQERLCRLGTVSPLQLLAVRGGGEQRRDRDDHERYQDLDQREAGGTSLRHEVLTGSPA
jgi:hypothetical protein